MFTFQFLIGRLKTMFSETQYQLLFMFQFLIGRLKTTPFSRCKCVNIEFQFLIGRLKTDIILLESYALQSFNSS